MTRHPKRALIIYSRVGGGHQSAARAMSEAIERVGGGCWSTELADVYVAHSRFPVTRFPSFYAHMARHRPRLWQAVFDQSNQADSRLLAATLAVLDPLVRPGLRRLARAAQPDLIISTLPGVNGLLSSVAAELDNKPPVEVVLTDWSAIHRTWIADGVEHYTAPTEAARGDCLRHGAASDRVAVVGLPVREAFSDAPAGRVDRGKVRSDLGLDPGRFTVLAMVGAEGSPRSFPNIRRVAGLQLDAQLVVICGRNAHLRSAVEALPPGLPRRVFGFVDNVAELMAAADLLITKAGGITLAEAFCCSTPVVVHDVLPGQEAGNTVYVQEKGAAAYAATADGLAGLVCDLWASPERRVQLAANAERLARPAAARQIADAMLERVAAR